jgi:hypothetical protein
MKAATTTQPGRRYILPTSAARFAEVVRAQGVQPIDNATADAQGYAGAHSAFWCGTPLFRALEGADHQGRPFVLVDWWGASVSLGDIPGGKDVGSADPVPPTADQARDEYDATTSARTLSNMATSAGEVWDAVTDAAKKAAAAASSFLLWGGLGVGVAALGLYVLRSRGTQRSPTK